MGLFAHTRLIRLKLGFSDLFKGFIIMTNGYFSRKIYQVQGHKHLGRDGISAILHCRLNSLNILTINPKLLWYADDIEYF